MTFSWEDWLIDFANYGWWEIPAVIAALLYVFLAAKKNRWCFLFGMISSLIYVYLTFRLKLYFDLFINTYYVAMSIYGWFEWKEGRNDRDIPIRRLGLKKVTLYSLPLLLGSFLLGMVASRYSDAALPYWDAFTTLFSLLATYWVVKRYLENWLVWIAVDFVACFIYWYKGLPLTSILFFIYTVISLYGYRSWKMQWKEKAFTKLQ